MAILEKEVWVVPANKTIKHYEALGYDIPRYKDNSNRLKIKLGTKILVKVKDLPNYSNVKVTKICDRCNCLMPNHSYNQIMVNRKNNSDGKDYCKSCANNQKREIDNVSLQENKKLKNTHPHIALLLKDKSMGEKLSYGSNKKVEFSCDRCNHPFKRVLANVVRHGFSCPRCSDGLSYPEKFMMNLLSQLDFEFESQKLFKWSNNKRYDIYIPSLKCIIEVHGEQHYKGNFKSYGGRTKEDEVNNDKVKENLATNNGIKHYIAINCSKSELNFIKNNILKSKLNELLMLSDVNWIDCHQFALNSLVKVCCDFWNNGLNNTLEIGKELKIARSTVSKYLKLGAELGWCEYDAKTSYKELRSICGKQFSKKVIQLSVEGEWLNEFASIKKAADCTGSCASGITSVCKGKARTSGNYRWMYKEDYQKSNGTIQPLSKIIKGNGERKVVQLSLDGKFIKEWESITQASNSTGIKNSSYITSAIKSNTRRRTAGGYRWMYKEDYDKNKNNLQFKPITGNTRKVVQLSKEGNFIKIWESVANASNCLQINRVGICHVCGNRAKMAGGYKWMYKEDYEKYIQQQAN